MNLPRPRRVVTPLAAFLSAESTGALVLLAATALAIVWANSPWVGRYEQLWHTEITLVFERGVVAAFDLRHVVNELLMTLFFLVVGLEIKREFVDGELADRRKAALPVAAALGGMIVPAAIYLAINAGGPGARGWGIPIATDIAFALGVLALLGRGLPAALRIFLLSLAIADDIGSIVVIALFYSGAIDVALLVVAVVLLVGLAALWRVRAAWTEVPIVVVMAASWLATIASGVHPTIAAVAWGLITPAGGRHPSPAERIGRSLHPWTSYVVVPLFALANAGVALHPAAIMAALTSPITLGVVAGLVVGKLVGVTAGAYLAVRVGIAVLPSGVRWSQLVATAAIAGIGFTVSLFIARLSFGDAPAAEDAKAGILVGSAAAAALGALLLRASARHGTASLVRVHEESLVTRTARDDVRQGRASDAASD